MFIDAHAHLDRKYLDEPLDDVIERACGAGVAQIILVGCGVVASREAVSIARRYPGRLFAAVGVHPHDSGKMTNSDFDEIVSLAESPEVVAIGETGLDYHYDRSPRDVQREVFGRFLDLANSLNKPVVVHSREAEEDTIRLLRDKSPIRAGGQLHCFTGSRELALAALEMGFFISFSGALTFANAGRLRTVARDIPLDRLIIETDCPFMTPAPFRGRTNEPMFVSLMAGTLAAEHGLSIFDIAGRLSASTRRLFSMPDASVCPPIAFASQKALLVAVGGRDLDSSLLLEKISRYPISKIERIVPFAPEGMEAQSSLLETLDDIAIRYGKVFDPLVIEKY